MNWYCMKCGNVLHIEKVPQGEARICRGCGILYTIHGTGVYPSLFIVGAENYPADDTKVDGE